jgi:hypothetical protein
MQIVSRLEQAGGRLSLNGDRIKYAVPKGSQEAHELLSQLREHRERLGEILRQRACESREHWPPEGLEVERRFGQPHAKLFSFIGRKVRTPQGPGTLIQVYADRVTVLLDADRHRCARFGPQEIAPAASLVGGGMGESHA